MTQIHRQIKPTQLSENASKKCLQFLIETKTVIAPPIPNIIPLHRPLESSVAKVILL
ncbi:MAG: hypothetical protein ABI045_00440 [Flavobacteriales bacterium]